MTDEKAGFVTTFVCNFLAAHAANVYANPSLYDRTWALANPPVSDAFAVASDAWEKFIEKLEEVKGED